MASCGLVDAQPANGGRVAFGNAQGLNECGSRESVANGLVAHGSVPHVMLSGGLAPLSAGLHARFARQSTWVSVLRKLQSRDEGINVGTALRDLILRCGSGLGSFRSRL